MIKKVSINTTARIRKVGNEDPNFKRSLGYRSALLAAVELVAAYDATSSLEERAIWHGLMDVVAWEHPDFIYDAMGQTTKIGATIDSRVRGFVDTEIRLHKKSCGNPFITIYLQFSENDGKLASKIYKKQKTRKTSR